MRADNAVLDDVFAALSDATRREVVERLMQGPATVTELAQPHGMSLPGFMKHLRVLEAAGLVTRSKEGRVVSCEFAAESMREAALWLAHYEQFWSGRLDALGRYLYHQEEVQPWRKEARSRKAQPRHHPPSPGCARKGLAGLDRPASAEPLVRSGRDRPRDPCRLDVRVGGRYRIAFRTDDGQEHDVSGEYLEVVVNRALQFTWAWKTTPERVSLARSG